MSELARERRKKSENHEFTHLLQSPERLPKFLIHHLHQVFHHHRVCVYDEVWVGLDERFEIEMRDVSERWKVHHRIDEMNEVVDLQMG